MSWYKSHESMVPNMAAPLLTASATAEIFSTSHRNLYAEKYVLMGSPVTGLK